jgi:hypothetical protein
VADNRWQPSSRAEWVEYAAIALALLVALVMWLFQIGPPPLLLVPWLVVAVLGARVVADRTSRTG